MRKLLFYFVITFITIFVVLQIMGLSFDWNGATNYYPYLVKK